MAVERTNRLQHAKLTYPSIKDLLKLSYRFHLTWSSMLNFEGSRRYSTGVMSDVEITKLSGNIDILETGKCHGRQRKLIQYSTIPLSCLCGPVIVVSEEIV